MLSAYLFSLVLGGGFLLLSLLSGEGGEGDIDVDVDFDVDVDVDLGMDAGDVDVGDIDGSSDVAAGKIFSFRGLIYALFGFGATGTVLTQLGFSFLPTLLAAIVGGVLSSALVTSVFNYLRRTDSGAHLSDATFIGAPGRVVLPLTEGAPGAVVVERAGREVRLRALPHDTGEGNPAEWKRIMVVEVDAGVAHVVPIKEDTLLNP